MAEKKKKIEAAEIAENPATRPGPQTTEFKIVAVILAILGAVMAHGYIEEGSETMRIVSTISMAATALGYAGLRSFVKWGAAKNL